MDPLSLEQRIEAIRRLDAASDQYPEASTLKAIDKLLVFGEVFSYTDLERIVGKRAYPLQVERGIELYLMMARVMKLCEPKGEAIGPACALQQINFERLTRDEALDLRNGIGFRLLGNSLKSSGHFSGLELLTDEEKELYERVKPYFEGRGKPTLKVLAARLLRDAHDRSFSERTVLRYIEALKNYKFADQNHRRDYLIHSVNRFGAHNKSARESTQYAIAQTVMQIGPVIREQMILMAETAQLAAQTLPRIPEILPQIREQMRETLQHVRQSLPLIAQAVAQIPVVLPQLHIAVAQAYRSVPQTLSLLAKQNFNVRQN